MKTRPRKLVFARTYGNEAAWSTWKLLLVSHTTIGGMRGWRLDGWFQGQDGITGRQAGTSVNGEDCIVFIWHTGWKDITRAMALNRDSTVRPITRSPMLSTALSCLYHRRGGRRVRLLADEEHVDSAEIKVVVERQRGKTIIGGMLAGVELVMAIRQVRRRSLNASRRLTMTVFPLY